MRLDLKGRNIVFAGNFTPSKFDKFFFIKNKLFSEDEISTLPILNSLEQSQAAGKDLNVIVLLNQIVITSNNPEVKDQLDLFALTLVNVGELTITGIGFNFQWVGTDTLPLANLSRELFYLDHNKLITTHFNNGNAHFGTYASKDFKQARLKLDIKPATLETEIEVIPKDFIHFSFNFHFDVKSKDIHYLFGIIKEYDFYADESERIVSIYKS